MVLQVKRNTLLEAANEMGATIRANSLKIKSLQTKMGDVVHICLLVEGSQSWFVDDNKFGWIAEYRCKDGYQEVGINFGATVKPWIFDPRF